MLVVRALYDFRAETPHEASFCEGQIFHVLDESNEYWYEVAVRNDRKMVPKSYFTVESKAPVSLIGIAIHDFTPELEYEMAVSRGDSLILMAISDCREWFLAKHAQRVQDPGIVPVSHIQLASIGKNIAAGDETKRLPLISEWKQLQRFKYISIQRPLVTGVQAVGSLTSIVKQPARTTDYICLSLTEFAHHLDEYWYILCVETATRKKYLRKSYDDFFHFHKRLMKKFPIAAGTWPGSRRIIPLLPGPSIRQNIELVRHRFIKINEYVGKLLDLPENIVTCPEFTSFLEYGPSNSDIPADAYRETASEVQTAWKKQESERSSTDSGNSSGSEKNNVPGSNTEKKRRPELGRLDMQAVSSNSGDATLRSPLSRKPVLQVRIPQTREADMTTAPKTTTGVLSSTAMALAGPGSLDRRHLKSSFSSGSTPSVLQRVDRPTRYSQTPTSERSVQSATSAQFVGGEVPFRATTEGGQQHYVKVRILRHADTQYLKVSRNTTLERVHSKVSQVFHTHIYSLMYMARDRSWVQIDTDDEWRELVHSAQALTLTFE